jgi:peroxiredoxin
MPNTSESIADQVAAFRATAPVRLPPDIRATLAAHVDELQAAAVPANVAQPGATLSDAPLTDAHGSPTSLHVVLGRKPTVIVFYRGAWCPYCNIALKTYREHLFPRLVELGIGLVAISPQRPDGSLTTQQKNELEFPVVSDHGNGLARQLGILAPARDDEVRSAQQRLGLDLRAVNADGMETLPMPAVVLVDAKNILRWIDVHPNFTIRTEVSDVLQAIGHLRSQDQVGSLR